MDDHIKRELKINEMEKNRDNLRVSLDKKHLIKDIKSVTPEDLAKLTENLSPPKETFWSRIKTFFKSFFTKF